MTDPTRISDPAVRALAREVTALRRELDTVKAGQRASQLGHSSVDDGSIWFTDAAGIKRVSIGKQVDGKFGWGAVNGEPPPRPTPPLLEAAVNGVTVGWDGQFIGPVPSDFTHVKAYLSPVGASFIPSDGNCVGHLLGNAKLPVTPLAETGHWCVLIAYNTSGVASEPSIVQGPVTPTAVVATDILDGIVTELKLADDAVTAAKLAAGAVGTAQLGNGVVDLSKLADGSVDATKIVDGSITPAKLSFSVEDIASIATYFQPDAPTGTIPAGSLWADSDDRNRLYRWSGSGWVELSDTGIDNALAAAQQAQTDAANALSAASGAEAAVDGKVTVFYQGTAPSGANPGDLWINTAESNRLQRWSGSTWTVVEDQRIATALANAATAQSTADGKIDAFYQGTAPAAGMSVGDLWYNTAAGNAVSRWNGTTWVLMPAGPGALADGAVTSGKVADNAIVAGKVAADAIGTNELAANSVVAGKIAADQITSTHIVAGGVQTANLAADSVAAGKIAADAITSREIQALSILADKIAANQIQAGHIEAGAITADKLEALMVLANTIIAGGPEDWHVEFGDANTPILYWNNEQTGFAVSRDQVTGQANTYMSGRVEFGNGSQIEQDYLDLVEQASTGFQTPRPRQYRHWVDSGPTTGVTARWVSATQPGSLCLMAVFQTAASGATPPNCGTPSGATIVTSQIYGPHRMTLFMVQNASPSRSVETFGSTAGAARWAIALVEYSGIMATAFDASAFNWGTGVTASSGTTSPTVQSNELQFAAFGSPSIGFSNGKGGQWNNPTSGFTKLVEGDGASGIGIVATSKTATGIGPVSTQITAKKSLPWMGVVATFRTAPADPTPPRPPVKVSRLFTRSRGGNSAPHIIDSSGATYPVGRVPHCRVYLTRDFDIPANTDVWAQGDWAIGFDPYGMAAIAVTPSRSNITVPVTGIYLIDYKTIMQSSTNTNNLGGAFVARNEAAASASVVRHVQGLTYGDTNATNRTASLAPGDRSPIQATRVALLTAGDVLYWGNWAWANTRTFAGLANIPTEITVTYLAAS